MIWTSDGSPATPSRTSLIAVVTSSVLASGFLETATPIPGLPLVREMLLGPPAVQGHVGNIRQPDEARLGSADGEVSHVLD